MPAPETALPVRARPRHRPIVVRTRRLLRRLTRWTPRLTTADSTEAQRTGHEQAAYYHFLMMRRNFRAGRVEKSATHRRAMLQSMASADALRQAKSSSQNNS